MLGAIVPRLDDAKLWYNLWIAGVAKLVDAHASGACGATLGGSSPLFGTRSGGTKPIKHAIIQCIAALVQR